MIQDPYRAYAELRAEGPVVQVAGVLHTTTFRAADAALRNPALGRGDFDTVLLEALGHGPLYESLKRWMLHLDPPDHTRLRGLASRAFTPRAVESLNESVYTVVETLLADLVSSGGGDFIADFAYPLTVQVICELLDVPDEDREGFRGWSSDVARALQMEAATPEIISNGNKAAEKLDRYFRELIVRRREHPRDTFLNYLIEAEGESGRLSEDELVATVVLLYCAGHETTVNLLGNGFYWLMRNREQWNLVVQGAVPVKNLVEEMLRFDTPVQRVTRIASREVEVEGTRLAEGEMLRILLGSANRDSEQFSDADRFIAARDDQRHLAFASGAHYCLGAYLARMEARIAMESLSRRLPNIQLAESDLPWHPNRVLRGLERLPVLT